MDYTNIPNGPKDKPFIFLNPDQADGIPYDITDHIGDMYMLDHDFEGCTCFAFSKKVQEKSGFVTLDDRPVPYVVKEVKLFSHMLVTMLGVRLRGSMAQYGQKGVLRISGFTDLDGNTMDTLELPIRAAEKALPLPEYRDHEAVALRAAEDGIVLLENQDAILPLKEPSTLNVFGKGLYDFQVCASGAGKINPRYVVDFREAVHQEQNLKLNRELEEFYRCDEDLIPDEEMLARARKQSDIGIFVLTRASGENMDNSTDPGEFYLSGAEERLLQKICEVFPRRIVILNVGYPVSMRFVKEFGIQAVVYCGFGGMLAGRALVNVLCGRVNPSGRLPDTWVYDYEDLPSAGDFYDCCGGKERYKEYADVWIDTVYHEGIYNGYRYFTTFGKKEAYPFGYGCSYTTFERQAVGLSYDADKGLTVEAAVKNTGRCAGRDVILLFVKKPEGVLTQPARELVAFEKTKLLAPGESQRFRISVPNHRMSSYDALRAVYLCVKGSYELYLGGDVRSAVPIGSFSLSGEKILKQVKNRMMPCVPIEMARSGVKENVSSLLPVRKKTAYPYHFENHPASEGRHLSFSQVQANPSWLDDYVQGLSVEQLARLSICAGDGWGMNGTGEAGRLANPAGENIPQMIVADGNSGVNMRKKNIGMPSGVTICATFDRALAEDIGRVIAEEARELGIWLILAPAFNIHRNPLCGRQPEYFSEDPVLAGKMAAAYCRGLEKAGVGGCYKHILANNAESSRKRNQSILSERALREIYAKAFEVALEDYQPVSVMTSYNAVNGAFTSTDADLLQGLLREEWGFRGFVMTDWGSYDTADLVEMVNAGNCWITPGSSDRSFVDRLVQAEKSGSLDVHRLRENVWYLLRAVLQLAGGNGMHADR